MSSLSEIKLNEAIEEIRLGINEIRTESVKTLLGKSVHMKYTYKKIIGKGSFGVVVSILNIASNERLALKRVYQDRKYHNRELETLLQLDHPNIIKLSYFNFAEKTVHGYYLNLFFELGDVSFEQLVVLRRRFAEEVVYGFLVQGLRALEYLERKEIVHRDIKPANLVLVGDRLVKLCDFGSAKKISRSSTSTAYICSRYYRAPENIMGFRDYDGKIDVWALCLSIMELLTFSPVFPGTSSLDQLRRILRVAVVSDEFKKKHNLRVRDGIGIDEYLRRIVNEDRLKHLLRDGIVFERENRLSASELLARHVRFEDKG